jgi:hypothetical protein
MDTNTIQERDMLYYNYLVENSIIEDDYTINDYLVLLEEYNRVWYGGE